jgi:hypothetical protein
MDEIRKEALSDNQLSDVNGGLDIGSVSLPIDMAGLPNLNAGPGPAEAMANAASQLAEAMGKAMQNAAEAQGGMQSIVPGAMREGPGLKP